MSIKTTFTVLVICMGLAFPFPTNALFDFGGKVTNVPGVYGSIMSAGAMPVFPPPGVGSFIYPSPACLNGVQEVNQIQAPGIPQPPVLLQFVGQYTFAKGPAMHPGQLILGKYAPVPMVCMALFVFWIYCGYSLCPVTIPLPFFVAPLILYNGSSI